MTVGRLGTFINVGALGCGTRVDHSYSLGRSVNVVGHAGRHGFRCPNDQGPSDRQLNGKGPPDRWKPLLPAEVKHIVRLYLAGKFDQ
jgi:hypothetical protein